MAILSKLLSVLSTQSKKQTVVDKVLRKFASVPNTGYLEIWLQRATLHSKTGQSYSEPLCKLASGAVEPIWNSSWISSKPLRNSVEAKKIVKKSAMRTLPEVINPSEVQLFEVY